MSQETDKPIYTSKPMQIGNHFWRMVIDRSRSDDRRLATRFEFQDPSGAFWSDQRQWPEYNINDTYLGLPRNLEKLHERELPALRLFGFVPHPPLPKQLEMRL